MTQTLIDPAEMRSRLLSLDEARNRLASTEGLAEYEFATDGSTNKLNFTFPDNWNAGLDGQDDFFVTPAVLDLDGTEIPLTKSGALELASEVGLNNPSALSTPGSIVQDYVNYHYSHGARGKHSLKILASDVGALAVTRGSIQPFSDLSLLESVVGGIQDKFGTDDVLIDYKWNHTLADTKIRVILPSVTRNIGSARAENAGNDPWSLGIEISNSIQGKHPLELTGSLFAWWCTNGMTTTRASSGKYRRKPTLTPDDAYVWARGVTDSVFNDLEPELDRIEHLTGIALEGEINDVVSQIFTDYGLPENARDRVMANLVDNDDITAYGLVNAITQAANDVDNISANEVSKLLQIGGDVAGSFDHRCPTCHSLGR